MNADGIADIAVVHCCRRNAHVFADVFEGILAERGLVAANPGAAVDEKGKTAAFSACAFRNIEVKRLAFLGAVFKV